MAQIHALTPEGRLPTAAVAHVREIAGVYDTGWRNITNHLINGWTATSVLIRRDSKWGIIRFQDLNGAAATSEYFAAGITGFFIGGQNVPVQVGATPVSLWVIGNGSQISTSRTIPVSSTPVQANQYLGDLARPSILPGTPS